MFASLDPGNPSASWIPVIVAPSQGGPRRIVAVACPGADGCLALDAAVVLHVGAPPPSANEIRNALRPGLRLAYLRRARARTVTVRTLLPGGLLIVCYRARTTEVLAYAAATFGSASHHTLQTTLTRRGRSVLAQRRAPSLSVMAAFAPAVPSGVPHGRPVRAWVPVRLTPN